MEEKRYSVIDLFCGIGGFSKGFEKMGFDIVLGIDNWEVALKTFKKNHKNSKYFLKDLREISKEEYSKFNNKVDVVIAGPPCQGFSMSGKRDINDSRNTLFEEVIRCVKYVNPKIVVIENVVGLLSMKNPDGKFVKDLVVEKLFELGYETKFKVLDASDYGVPQARKRVIFIGSRIGKIDFPSPEKNKVDVGNAFGNIPDVHEKKYLKPKTKFQKEMSSEEVPEIHNHVAMNHNETIKKRIAFVPQGGNWKDVPKEYYQVRGEHSNNYRRLDPNKPSITIKHATKSMIIHPTFNRVITAREVARLQSFGDDFILEGNITEQHQQLANAVPVFLGKAIAKEVKKGLKNEKKFTFIDLFSGIGGFRLALEGLGGKCVFSSDIDEKASDTYEENFGERPSGDITKIPSEEIPDHDILCGGFPCQPFSIGGFRKGFEDTRGTLFFEVERILRDKKPKAFFLENVRGLINHNKGRTFSIIKKRLNELGYDLHYKIFNSKDYGIPQNRERIFIVGFNKKNSFTFPNKKLDLIPIEKILEKNVKGHGVTEIAKKHILNHLNSQKHKKKVALGGKIIVTEVRPSRCTIRNDGISPCLTAKMGTGGNNVPILVDEMRKLTVRECLRLQGFPEEFKMKENYGQSYKQLGNSVTVPLIKRVAENIVKEII